MSHPLLAHVPPLPHFAPRPRRFPHLSLPQCICGACTLLSQPGSMLVTCFSPCEPSQGCHDADAPSAIQVTVSVLLISSAVALTEHYFAEQISLHMEEPKGLQSKLMQSSAESAAFIPARLMQLRTGLVRCVSKPYTSRCSKRQQAVATHPQPER